MFLVQMKRMSLLLDDHFVHFFTKNETILPNTQGHTIYGFSFMPIDKVTPL
jgi:hypothetical protein